MLAEFCRHYKIPFRDLGLLKLALTHRSYLSVTGQGPRESNERLEFLGDSVLGLVTSEALYRRHPDEHEGQLTKTKSLLVSKAILSRRALRMGLGRFVLMSHSEVESGGRQRLSILADAFESVIGAVYLDQGFETARTFIHDHLLADSDAITSDKRHTNYKSHLQEYVQNAFRTHPVYRIRSEFGPDHSKHFVVEVMVGKRSLGEGRGHNKKEAEQAAARDALEKVEKLRLKVREDDERDVIAEEEVPRAPRRHGRDREDRDTSRDVVEERGPRRERESRRDRDARREREREQEQEPRHAVAPPVEPRPVAKRPDAAPAVRDEDDDRDEDAESGPRRRRSRRGGRRRHGRGAEDARESSPATAEDSDPRRTPEPEPMVRHAEEQVSARGASIAPAPGLEWDEPEPEPADEWPPVAPAVQAIPASPVAEPSASRPVSFGRGRRRGFAPAPAVPVANAPGPVDADAERLLDPFDTSEPREVAEIVPVVDVQPPAEVVGEESEKERDARIEEMERALENFGRRRSPDYGRRGRRR